MFASDKTNCVAGRLLESSIYRRNPSLATPVTAAQLCIARRFLRRQPPSSEVRPSAAVGRSVIHRLYVVPVWVKQEGGVVSRVI